MCAKHEDGTHTGTHRWAQDNLSAYIDGELTPAEAKRLEAHLHACATCASDLQTLLQTAEWLGMLPEVPAPRSFAIPAPMRQPAAGFGLSRLFPAFRAGALAAAVLLVAVVSTQLVATTFQAGRVALAPAMQSVAPSEEHPAAPLARKAALPPTPVAPMEAESAPLSGAIEVPRPQIDAAESTTQAEWAAGDVESAAGAPMLAAREADESLPPLTAVSPSPAAPTAKGGESTAVLRQPAAAPLPKVAEEALAPGAPPEAGLEAADALSGAGSEGAYGPGEPPATTLKDTLSARATTMPAATMVTRLARPTATPTFTSTASAESAALRQAPGAPPEAETPVPHAVEPSTVAAGPGAWHAIELALLAILIIAIVGMIVTRLAGRSPRG